MMNLHRHFVFVLPLSGLDKSDDGYVTSGELITMSDTHATFLLADPDNMPYTIKTIPSVHKVDDDVRQVKVPVLYVYGEVDDNYVGSRTMRNLCAHYFFKFPDVENHTHVAKSVCHDFRELSPYAMPNHIVLGKKEILDATNRVTPILPEDTACRFVTKQCPNAVFFRDCYDVEVDYVNVKVITWSTYGLSAFVKTTLTKQTRDLGLVEVLEVAPLDREVMKTKKHLGLFSWDAVANSFYLEESEVSYLDYKYIIVTRGNAFAVIADPNIAYFVYQLLTAKEEKDKVARLNALKTRPSAGTRRLLQFSEDPLSKDDKFRSLRRAFLWWLE